MKKIVILVCLTALVGLFAFKANRPALFIKPAGWPKPVYNFKKNPLTAEKVALGKRLFHDPVLSRDSSISCVSCHSPYTAFTHLDHNLSHGIAGKIGTRNSPALMNLAWSNSFMWDGAVKHLDEQAVKPITNPLEMDESMDNVVKKLKADKTYRIDFAKAYGDSTINEERILKSLSQFMLTLVSANAKYDSVMRKEATFTEMEAKGYQLFQQHCSTCHTEPLFTNEGFENNGLMVDNELKDIGHMKVTGNKDDSLKFKVPSLRNVQYSYPYMHDGRFKTLNQVLSNYTRGVQLTPTLNPVLKKGIYMTNMEKAEIIAFLMTLTDKSFLNNPAFTMSK